MITLYLIRHGETRWNAEGRLQGHRDSSLNAGGIAQARIVAKFLTQVSFDAIYTSDLGRAAETARIIAAPHRITPTLDMRLREACLGDWEGFTMPEINERWPEAVAAWRQDSLHHRPPNGESLEHVQARVAKMLDEIVSRHPDGQVAIVGHGGSIKAVITIALSADLSAFRHIRLDNCSISLVTVNNGHYSVVRMNDVCHLQSNSAHATFDETNDQERPVLLRPQ